MTSFVMFGAITSEFNLLAARLQMALTLGFHIVLAVFGVGMPVLMLWAEWRYLKTGDVLWKTLAKRWSKVFAVLFAVGAVSGTVLSFELGLLWPEFMARFGAVIGLPFTLEGFAFFLEAIFVGIYLYGWDRLPPRAHWWAGVPIAVSGFASAWFVVTVNAWMNAPQGFRLENGKVVEADPIVAMLNPATGAQTTHMIVAAYLVTGFMIASAYAAARLRGHDSVYHRRAMSLGLVLGAVMAPVQFVVGDWSARVVAETQPVKLAALEGQFQTETGAPLRIGGLPDDEARTTRYAVEIPGLLSWLAYGNADAVVKGLDDYPRADTPPTAIVHVAFQTMVGIATLLLLLSVYCGWRMVKHRRLPEGRWFLWLLSLAGPLSLMSMEAGWVVTEVGRQPWIVQGVARTATMVTAAPGVGWVLAATLAIYATLLVGMLAVLRLLARTPIEGAHVTPELIILATMLLGLTLYALLGGADFGAGVWEFNTALQSSDEERDLIYRAIGPVWEANHVWLIFVIVGMFGAFPPAFAGVCRALWLPLFLALAGIVFRGVGFAFRSYAAGAVRQQAAWGAVFALASTATPLFLGAAVGSLASGKLPVETSGQFTGNYIYGWLGPLAIFNGFFVVGLCAYLAAVYLAREADQLQNVALTRIWRRRALATGLWLGVLAFVGLTFVSTDAPQLWEGFQERAWPLVALSVVTGFFSLFALWFRSYRSAVIGAATTVSSVVWGWAIAQYPYLVPPSITIESAKSPEYVLWLMVASIAAGAVLLLPSLGYLFYLFKGKRPL